MSNKTKPTVRDLINATVAKLKFLSALPSDLSDKVIELGCNQISHGIQGGYKTFFEVIKAATPVIEESLKTWDKDSEALKVEMDKINDLVKPKDTNV